jgi:uncharacterized protein YuzE
MRLEYDDITNTLWLTLERESRAAGQMTSTASGVIDIATNGRLVGIEVRLSDNEQDTTTHVRRWLDDPAAAQFTSVNADGTAYIQLSNGGDALIRSTVLNVTTCFAGNGDLSALGIPRRGPGYEISYPSGNT